MCVGSHSICVVCWAYSVSYTQETLRHLLLLLLTFSKQEEHAGLCRAMWESSKVSLKAGGVTGRLRPEPFIVVCTGRVGQGQHPGAGELE